MNNLTRYDPVKNCFVLAGVKKQYWPGTNLEKSRGNAFDWRNVKDVRGENEMSSMRSMEHR